MADVRCPECNAAPASVRAGEGPSLVVEFACGSTPQSLAEGVHISNARELAQWRRRLHERAAQAAREAAHG